LVTTVIEEAAIATPAKAGLISHPNQGKNAPAASGISSRL
jgi:hypothetical protein